MIDRRFNDEFVATVLWMVERAANTGARCPSNEELAHAGGFKSMSSGARAIMVLQTRGVIQVQRSTSSRIVTIVATGKRTAGKIAKARLYGKGSRPPVDPEKRERRLGRYQSDGSAGHVVGPPLPASQPFERTICPRCGVRSEAGCRHVQQEARA